MDYYIIINNEQKGPYSKESLLPLGVTANTLVWHAGLPDWTPASQVESLTDLFEDSAFGTYAEVPPMPEQVVIEETEAPGAPGETLYYAMLAGQRVGPSRIEELIAHGLSRDTDVWCEGMEVWAPAYTRPDIVNALNAGGQQPRQSFGPQAPQQPPYGQAHYGAQQPYGQAPYGAQQPNGQAPYGARPQQPYGYQGYPKPHYNWQTWAIIGTIFGFLFSCIGGIFGIIGIVNSNKANQAFAMGDEATGESANASAKTMTIISLVFCGLGLLVNLGMVVTGVSGVLDML